LIAPITDHDEIAIPTGSSEMYDSRGVVTHPPTVLVLDDDAAVRASLDRLLRSYGYAPLTAATVAEATSLMAASRVDALILDVRLGRSSNGLDLMRSIRASRDFDAAPILILTGAALSAAEEALITSQRAYLFHKPEGFRALVRFLDTLRDQPH
jgi:DNA-binding response OmpR family regulator